MMLWRQGKNKSIIKRPGNICREILTAFARESQAIGVVYTCSVLVDHSDWGSSSGYSKVLGLSM